ncbi:MAG: lysophospholipid acyltransferase family protein [Nitriliruptor sp.]|uniref:lysophospholipid acyltransferase family protein n=1 Tax=Nitriliruptor sp. TaxID=2448056 RepID=UPI0034A01156
MSSTPSSRATVVSAPVRTGQSPTAMVPGARSLVRLSLRPVFRAWLRLGVEGAHHVPTDGATLLASTHQSHADSVAIAVALERPIHFLGDLRLVSVPVLGPLLPRIGMVPLRRGDADAAALHVLTDLLDDDRAVAVYPEGSRSRDGRVHRLRSGVARLAAASGAPVVPTAVVGIFEVWPIGSRPKLRGGRVTVRFGEPLAAPTSDTPRARRAFTDDLHDALITLSGFDRADDFSAIGGGA